MSRSQQHTSQEILIRGGGSSGRVWDYHETLIWLGGNCFEAFGNRNVKVEDFPEAVNWKYINLCRLLICQTHSHRLFVVLPEIVLHTWKMSSSTSAASRKCLVFGCVWYSTCMNKTASLTDKIWCSSYSHTSTLILSPVIRTPISPFAAVRAPERVVFPWWYANHASPAVLLYLVICNNRSLLKSV